MSTTFRAPLAIVVCLLGLPALRAQFTPPPPPPMLTMSAAVQYALENNPGLNAQRQNHGIAAAKVVIADTYPFNPIAENRVQAAMGPQSAGITNSVPLEHLLLLEVELRGQRKYRRQGAAAGLSRTDWEIAYQEQTLAVQVIRAYIGLIYRQEKLRLIEQTLRINQQLVEDARRLITAGKLKPGDRVTAESELLVTQDALKVGQTELVTARQELFRVLGVVNMTFDLEGALEAQPWNWDPVALSDLAVERRADLHARQAALFEASAAMKLAKANRYGNPVVGPAFTYDPTRITMVGAQVNVPIPLLNTHRGEIRQSEAEYALAAWQVEQAEITVRQDVASALARLDAAEQRAAQIKTVTIPKLKEHLEDLGTFLNAGEATILNMVDVRRKLLQAQDSYLDALWAVRQARADVLAATGEPVLGLIAPPAPQK
ncbi:MAG: TolC family protein [Gemmataceae bacterium]